MDKENFDSKATQPPQIQPVEQVRRAKSGGGVGCRTIGCIILIIPLTLCLLAVYVVLAKPESIWANSVDFFNAGFEQRTVVPITPQLAQNNFEGQISRVGENEIRITEDELTALGRQNLNQLKDLTVDIRPETIQVSWVLNDKIAQKPLYGIIEVGIENDQIVTKKIGTNRVGLPTQVSDKIVEVFFKTLKFGEDGVDSTVLLNELITDKSINIKKIDFDNDDLLLTLDVKVDVF